MPPYTQVVILVNTVITEQVQKIESSEVLEQECQTNSPEARYNPQGWVICPMGLLMDGTTHLHRPDEFSGALCYGCRSLCNAGVILHYFGTALELPTLPATEMGVFSHPRRLNQWRYIRRGQIAVVLTLWVPELCQNSSSSSQGD